MHIELCALGFEGSYDRVAAFARQWKMDQLARVNLASKGAQKGEKDPISLYLTSKLYFKGWVSFSMQQSGQYSAQFNIDHHQTIMAGNIDPPKQHFGAQFFSIYF